MRRSSVAIGTVFKKDGTTYTVVDFVSTRPKYPIVGKGPRGGKYRFSLEDLGLSGSGL